MPLKNNDNLQKAAKHWECGEPLEAGRLIFQNLPPELRPIWAASVLDFVIANTTTCPRPIMELRDVARDRCKWREAHRVFSVIRQTTLEIERLQFPSNAEECLLCQLLLAENIAKVIYNATAPLDEFDDDSGWWIAVCLRELVERCHDDDVSRSAWSVLSAVPEKS